MINEPLPGPIVHPARADPPLLLSVPHSGRRYPEWLVDMARGGRKALEPLEDPLVDRLLWRLLSRGVGAVIAQAPRAAIDCNRGEDEIDPMFIHGSGRSPEGARPSARARGGLGIVPSRTALHGHLWRRAISHCDLEQRLREAYRPFHDAVAAELERLVERFGCALLLDCHSMPPLSSGGCDLVFGDRYGRTAAPSLMATAIRVARDHGLAASANDPFAGGHVVERHGAPHIGVHALQVEVDRSCYLTRQGEPSEDFNRLAEFLETLGLRLGEQLLDPEVAAAAE